MKLKVETTGVFGNHPKGTILELPISTAKALIVHKLVKEIGEDKPLKEISGQLKK